MFSIRPDAAAVWRDWEVAGRLTRYRRVERDELPARFIVCRSIGAGVSLSAGDGELWRAHERCARELPAVLKGVDGGGRGPESCAGPSFLDLKAEIARRLLSHCVLCEWRCGADRNSGKRGSCRLGAAARPVSWFHHMGEEAPLIGERGGGSGTIFFASCVFRCVYCQNHDISQDPSAGEEMEPDRLARIIGHLRGTGAANVNFVGGDPIPDTHTILRALAGVDENIPTVWNSNMYCTPETMALINEVTDFWLPDFKYGNDECAWRLSKVKRYFEVTARNHRYAHDAGSGEMIVRHLVLPGHTDCCSIPVLDFISKNLPRALVNIMDQYRPEYLVRAHPDRFPELGRRVSPGEMDEVRKAATARGIAWEEVSH